MDNIKNSLWEDKRVDNNILFELISGLVSCGFRGSARSVANEHIQNYIRKDMKASDPLKEEEQIKLPDGCLDKPSGGLFMDDNAWLQGGAPAARFVFDESVADCKTCLDGCKKFYTAIAGRERHERIPCPECGII